MTVETMAARRFERAWPSATAADVARTLDAPWFVFRAGGQLQALPISYVIETMPPQPVVPVAGAPDYVLGISVIRGQPVPVVDTGRLVGGTPTEASRVVTVRLGARTVGLVSEAVLGKQDIGPTTLMRLPPLLGSTSP